jgi:hypothetical protein
METIESEVVGWLDTFIQATALRDNPEAAAKEVATIVGVFARENATPETVEAAFQHIKMTETSRAWPTAAVVYQALRDIRREKAQQTESVTGQGRGDRHTLDGIQLTALENKVLPTARRWLRMYPGLRSHAIAVLEYWSEPLIDDMGRDHAPKVKK